MSSTQAALRLPFSWPHALFGGGFLVCLLAGISPALALASGLLLASVAANPFTAWSSRLSGFLIKSGVVLLGFSMDLAEVLSIGVEGALAAALTIGATLVCGRILGRWLRVGGRTSFLISAGTAICGGSAIAAVAVAIGAATQEVAVALGTVFVLNAAALYLFPWLGEVLGLGAEAFGFWAGVAIHDLSSVVGASSRFGLEGMQIATAVKLSRTLWIVPVALLASAASRRVTGLETGSVPRWPVFILLFVAASACRGLVPAVADLAVPMAGLAHAGLTAALFVIGASLSPAALRRVGWRPLAQGALLWLLISTLSLGLVLAGW